MKQHLLIIIDNNKIIDPQKYTQNEFWLDKREFISQAKTLYEKNHKNIHFTSYYFLNEI